DKVFRLGEIIAGYCLALDLSTMSAMANGTFVKAHERLGRNRPASILKKEDITASFVEKIIRQSGGDIHIDTMEVQNDFSMGDSILAEFTSRNENKFIGLMAFKMTGKHDQSRKAVSENIIVKSKPMDIEVIHLNQKMAGMSNSRLSQLIEKYKFQNESLSCHLKEIAIYSRQSPLFKKYSPRLFGIESDPKREVFIIVMEQITDPVILGKADRPHLWTRQHIEAAISGMAELHSIWLCKNEELLRQPWIGFVHNARSMAEQKEMFFELIKHASVEFPELMTEDIMSFDNRLIEHVESWYAEFDMMPKTLIHNDFNPRNIALRLVDGKLTLCAFDWELATIHVPQHDLSEFLSFVITEQTSDDDIFDYIELHRQALEKAASVTLDPAMWRRGVELSLYDLAINRFAMYLMAHNFRDFTFLKNVISNNFRLISCLKTK
ncbi:MAG: phosphotransferase, partial [Oligoflexales bacterium]|nr:phosphotransferase [Oligoflexales bacterium]